MVGDVSDATVNVEKQNSIQQFQDKMMGKQLSIKGLNVALNWTMRNPIMLILKQETRRFESSISYNSLWEMFQSDCVKIQMFK